MNDSNLITSMDDRMIGNRIKLIILLILDVPTDILYPPHLLIFCYTSYSPENFSKSSFIYLTFSCFFRNIMRVTNSDSLTMQLLSLSCLYLAAWLPNTIIAVIRQLKFNYIMLVISLIFRFSSCHRYVLDRSLISRSGF